MTDNALEGVSLMDLAGLDTTGLEAKRMGDVLPRMFADWECIKSELAENKDAAGKVTSFMAKWEWKVLGVHTMIDKDAGKEEDQIGRVHTEVRFIKDTDGIKFTLGFIEDVGVKQRGPFGGLIEAVQGKRIKAVLQHRTDKNDRDKVYAGLAKIKPLQAA